MLGQRATGAALRSIATLPDDSMRSPDAAWVSSSRLDPLMDEEGDRFAPLCPELVVELRSASDLLPDVAAKMVQWMANGAKLAWLIDPQLKRVTVYRAGRSAEQLEEPAIGGGRRAGGRV